MVENLKELIDISSIIYSKIQDYGEHMAFADYLVKTQSHNPIISNSYGIYQSIVNSLTTSMQYNVVNQMYTKSIHSIQQWIFPFAYHILEDCSPLVGPIDQKIAVMKENLLKIKRRVDNYLSTVQIIDESILKMQFTESSPFYSWSCEKNQKEIEDLLNGKQVILKTDIKSIGKNAVKFNRIDVKITSRVSESNIESILEENFKIKVKHSGNAYFKYYSTYYTITNNKPFLLLFSFEKGPKCIPINNS